MEKNKICFITARLKGDYCFDAIKEMGYQIEIPYKDFNLLLRCMREAWFRLKLPARHIWFNHRCKDMDVELFIVRDSLIEPDYLKWLRKHHPNARIVLDYENLARTTIDPERIIDCSVELWSYDQNDCERYGMNKKRIAYYDSWKAEKTKPEYDLVYVGRDKGRAEQLLALEDSIKALGVNPYFHICANRRFQTWQKSYYKPLLTYAEYLKLIGKSKSVLNIVQVGSSSITLRELEAVFHGIKSVTNNLIIKEFPLYHPSRYFILGEDDFELLPTFLAAPFEPVKPEELEPFRFDRYVEDMYFRNR